MLMMMRADKGYTPNEKCSLEEMVACALAEDTDACLAACTGNEGGEEEVLPGYATVSTKAASTQTVALNAVEKKIGTVTLKAGENDTTVTALEITKAGLWDPEDILTIQLMKDGEYVSNAAHLTTKKTATLRFSPKLTIKAGKSETFDVVVSLKGEKANGQHDFSVTAVTVANGTFGGTPAKLGSLVTTNYTVWDVEVELSDGNENLSAWDENVDLVAITLKPSEEAEISSVTLTSNKDELNKTFSNVKAYIDDEVVWTVSVNDETITISDLKETVKKGKKLDIVVKWDVTYAWDTLDLTLTVEDNHVNAIETNTNERMASALKENEGPARLKVKWVDLTLKNLVKKTQKVAPGTTDVVLMDLELTAGVDLEVTKYYVKLPDAFPFNSFEDDKVVLYVDGINYDITGQTLEISKKADYFAISAGDKVSIQVMWDALDSIDWSIEKIEFGITEVKNTENNKTITPVDDDEVLVSEKGHKTTFSAGSVTVKNTLKTTNNLIEEWETSEVLWFSIKASNEKVTVRSMEFALEWYKLAEDEDNTEIVEKVALYKKWSNTALKTVEFDDIDEENGTVTMENLSQSINADDTVEYILKATLNDWSVKVLWQEVSFKLSKVIYKSASAEKPANDSTEIEKVYQVSSTKPTFKLSKNGNKITVEVTNGSEYDINLNWFILQVIWNVNDNGNNPFANSLNEAWTWTLQDKAGNNLADIAVEFDNNFAWVAFADETIKAWETETYVVVMPQKAAIKSEYYEAEERYVEFVYTDDDDGESEVIEAEYNGWADQNTLPTASASTGDGEGTEPTTGDGEGTEPTTGDGEGTEPITGGGE